MSTMYGPGEFADVNASSWIASKLSGLRSAFMVWRKRRQMRAQLYGLSDTELADMGATRGEIEHVVSNHLSDHVAD